MKTNYLITGEATKYWKKAIKSDRVMIAGVNVKYDAMVNIELAKKVYCKGRYAPVVIADDYITAILMPVRLDDKFNNQVEEAFSQTIEGRRAKCI